MTATAGNEDVVLSIAGVSKTYAGGRVCAVQDVSLDVHAGEIIALVGESGSGKTTLLRLIAGLEHPDAGRIALSGRVVAEGQRALPVHERQVGMVFQDYALFPHLTILENVRYGLRMPAADRDRIARQALQLTGLQVDVKRYPHQLSGGQRQRVALARAIAPGPRLLLLDEPFSSLDTMLKDHVREEVRQIIRKAGMTAVLVTHDTHDALSVADRIAVMHRGDLQQVAGPRCLYEHPVNAYVANFFGRRNIMNAMAADDGFQTAFGFIPDATARRFGKGAVCLYFRPEDAEAGATMPLCGALHATVYYGDHQIIKLRDTEGRRVSVRARADVDFQPGYKVNFRLCRYSVKAAARHAAPSSPPALDD